MPEVNLQIPILDLVIIVTYMVGILVVGVLSTRHQKLTGDVYFLAGRSLGWVMVGAALFASNISTIHIVGLAASGYNEGLVWGNFEWAAGFTLIILGLVFAPFYFRNRIETLPEFLERRFGPGAPLGAGVHGDSGGVVHPHWNEPLRGSHGVRAVFRNQRYRVDPHHLDHRRHLHGAGRTQSRGDYGDDSDGGADRGLYARDGFRDSGAARSRYQHCGEFKAALRPGQISMIHTDNSVGLAWYAVLLGYPILGIWYWCTDQTIVQRVLAARSEHDAQIGPLFAGFIKILPVFIMVFPGVVGYVLFQKESGTTRIRSCRC